MFHDDQHGTAIVVLAAFLNALRVVGKRAQDVKVVLTGWARQVLPRRGFFKPPAFVAPSAAIVAVLFGPAGRMSTA